jgi:hypothetical protein
MNVISLKYNSRRGEKMIHTQHVLVFWSTFPQSWSVLYSFGFLFPLASKTVAR